MTLNAAALPIERPCPVDLDPALSDGSRASWHCMHCDKRVHVLSSMTEVEAREFLRAREGQDLCVTYLEGSDGTIKFRAPAPKIVPVSALAPRRLALGLGVALAACTPTERPPKPAPVVQVSAPEQSQATTQTKTDSRIAELVDKYKEEVEAERARPQPEPEPEPEPERYIPRPGGIRVPHIAPPTSVTVVEEEEEPCDPPATTIRRGGLRRRP